MTSRRRLFVALAPVYASVFLFAAGMSALQVLVPVYLARDAGLGPAAIGTVVAAFGIAALAARLPVGMSYSMRRGSALLLGGAALSATAFALIPFAHGTLALTLLMGLNGLGWSTATTAQLALLVARPPGGLSTAAAMGWFSGAIAMGNVSAVVGGVSADLIGLRPTFFVLAATPLVGALLMVRTSGATRAAAPLPRTEQSPTASVWRLLVRMPLPVWVGVLVMFFINGLSAITNTFHPLIALAAGLSLTQIAALSSVRSWASSSSRFGSGPLFQRFEAAGLTLPLVALGTVATCLIPSVIGSFLLQIPLFALAGVSRGLLRVTGSTDAFESVGDDDRRHGLVSAFLYGGLDLGKVAGPLIGGLVAHVVGVATMLQLVPLGFLALYLALAIPARRVLKPSPELP